jgi:hypothetical protein
MSKGATTVEGRRRIAEAQRRRWARWRSDRASGVPYQGKLLGRPRKAKAKEMTLAEWYAAKRQRAKDFLDPEKWGRLGK